MSTHFTPALRALSIQAMHTLRDTVDKLYLSGSLEGKVVTHEPWHVTIGVLHAVRHGWQRLRIPGRGSSHVVGCRVGTSSVLRL